MDTEGRALDLMIWTLLKEQHFDKVSSLLPCFAWDAAGREIDL